MHIPIRAHFACLMAFVAGLVNALLCRANLDATPLGGTSIKGSFDLSDGGSLTNGVANSSFSLDGDLGKITRTGGAHGSPFAAPAPSRTSFNGHDRLVCSVPTPRLYFTNRALSQERNKRALHLVSGAGGGLFDV